MALSDNVKSLQETIKRLQRENRELINKISADQRSRNLKQRIQFEKAIFQISSFFIGDYLLDKSISQTLDLLGNLMEVDRVYLYRFHHKAKLIHITYEWISSKSKNIDHCIPSIPYEELTWFIKQLKTKEIVLLKDIGNLPDRAKNEKEIFTRQGIKSLLAFPVMTKGELEGFVGLDQNEIAHEWQKEDLKMLKIAPDIIGFSIERKKSERSLKRTEQLYQKIFENTGAATLTIKADTTIQMVNSEFEKLLGYSREEIEGKRKLLDMVNKKYKSVIQKYHYLLLSRPEAVPKNYEFDYITKQGESRNAYMTGSIVLDPKTSLLSFIDITEFKEVERQLLRAKDKAEESDRLKSSFLTNVSHEIRTPLNAITGFSALLSDPNLPMDKKENYIKQILDGSNELVNLIDNVLDISRIESGTLKPKIAEFLLNVKLKEIHHFYDDYKIQQGKENLRIKLTLPPNTDKFLLKTDPYRLQQILANLLDNAIKFTVSGYVEFGYSIMPAQNTGLRSGTILFFVKDSGIGIAKKDKEKIFERFVKIIDRNDRLYRGAGLGLTLTKDLIHMLKGEIWVESALGKGSSFYFTIPYKHPKEKEAERKPRDKKRITDYSDKTILIAEDTESNFLYIYEILKGTKAKIIRAKDGKEAIELFLKNKDKIDLIFMDILMPEFDGFEATNRIREIKPDIVVVAQTAFTFEGESVDGLYAGCFDDYILKPFDVKIILKMVEKYLVKEE